MEKLNITALGDPLSRRTWSGTPFNICMELKKRDALGMTIDAKLGKFRKMALFGISKLMYRSADLERGELLRYSRSSYIQSQLIRAPRHTLHMSTLTLPFHHIPEGQHHYLLCDSTWNLWSQSSTHMEGYSARILADAERLEKLAYDQMDHIFPLSEYVKENLMTHYHIPEEKITVVGTGRGIIQPYFGEKDYTKPRILFVAKERFEDKGGPLLKEAFRMAVAQNPNLQLTVLGQDTYAEYFRDVPNVQVFGFIPMEQLQDIFNTHTLFALPARNEPWGLVYLEALSCKMPIVGLNRNAFPELSGHGKYGFALEEESPDALAILLLDASSNPDRLARMGKEGQRFCLDNFGWDKTVERILKVMSK